MSAMDFSKFDDRFIRHVNLLSNLGVIELTSGRAVGVGQCGDSVEVTFKVVDVEENTSDAHI